MFKPRTDGLDDAAAVQRIRELKNKVAFYKLKVDRWKTRCDKTGRALETVRRLLPSPAVAETLIPARLEAARQRARDPDAVARHQALIRTAHRYAQAVEAYHAGRMPNARRIRIGELAFWIPLDDQLPERVSRAKTQGLPWRAILSAREVSVGRVMLDIGANLGRTAIPRVVLGDIDIAYVAEPDPANYDCLVWSVLDNGLGGLVLPDQAAISCRDGEAELVRSRFVGGHVLRSPRTEGERQTTVLVPCYRLDAWVQRLNVELQDVSFVKVDVQGREPHVLRGAPQVLKHRHIAWQLEVDSGRLKRVGSRLDELFTLMETHFSWFLNLDKARTGPRMLPVEDLRRSLRHLDVKSSKTDLLLWR